MRWRTASCCAPRQSTREGLWPYYPEKASLEWPHSNCSCHNHPISASTWPLQSHPAALANTRSYIPPLGYVGSARVLLAPRHTLMVGSAAINIGPIIWGLDFA